MLANLVDILPITHYTQVKVKTISTYVINEVEGVFFLRSKNNEEVYFVKVKVEMNKIQIITKVDQIR